VALVITQGKWISPMELHEEIGIAPFVRSVPMVRALETKVVADSSEGGGAGQRMRASAYEAMQAD